MAGPGYTEEVADEERSPAAASPLANVLPFPSLGVARPPSRLIEPEPRLRTLIGEVVRDERHAQDRTLAEVAEQAAVSLPYLSEVERGVKEVSSDVLASICGALDLPLVDLLERSVQRLRARPQGGSGIELRAA